MGLGHPSLLCICICISSFCSHDGHPIVPHLREQNCKFQSTHTPLNPTNSSDCMHYNYTCIVKRKEPHLDWAHLDPTSDCYIPESDLLFQHSSIQPAHSLNGWHENHSIMKVKSDFMIHSSTYEYMNMEAELVFCSLSMALSETHATCTVFIHIIIVAATHSLRALLATLELPSCAISTILCPSSVTS